MKSNEFGFIPNYSDIIDRWVQAITGNKKEVDDTCL